MGWKEEILALEANWDGRSADPINLGTILKVEDFLLLNHFTEGSAPNVVPCPNGCIVLAWQLGNNAYLEAEFFLDECVSWMLSVPGAEKKYLHWSTR